MSDGLGGVGEAAEQVGEPGVDVPVVDGVAELVEHGVHPVGVGPYVGQHAYVVGVLAPDTGAEGVLALALPFVEVAPGYDTPHLEPQAVEGLSGQLLEVLPLEVAVEVDAGQGGCPVEERTPVLSKRVPRGPACGSERLYKTGLNLAVWP
jgi:hypothetical protein